MNFFCFTLSSFNSSTSVNNDLYFYLVPTFSCASINLLNSMWCDGIMMVAAQWCQSEHLRISKGFLYLVESDCMRFEFLVYYDPSECWNKLFLWVMECWKKVEARKTEWSSFYGKSSNASLSAWPLLMFLVSHKHWRRYCHLFFSLWKEFLRQNVDQVLVKI